MTTIYFFRSSLKTLFLSMAFMVLAINSFAQKKQPYTLLWQISGKGLSKPSYLFGFTLLRDDRSLNFSDSVFKSLSASTAFVVENHPDSLGDNKFHLINQSKANTGGIAQSYNLQTIDPKKTFAVAYLYGMARSQNKKIYGLVPTFKDDGQNQEDDATEMEEQDQDEADIEIESIISTYKDGNLDELWRKVQIYYEEDDGTGNKELFNQLNKLLASEQVFAAFNFPILAGEKGLIALFKSAGYTVRPVEAAFTAMGQDHAIDYTKMQRYTYYNEQSNYSVSFPSVPQNVGQGRSTVKNYTDPLNGVTYTTSTLFTGPLINLTSTQYTDTALVNYLSGHEPEMVKKNNINKFGGSVTEVTFKIKNTFAKTWLIHVHGTFFTFTAESKTEVANDPYIDQFFNSIQINEPKAISSSNWIDYKNPTGAFSIKIPIQPQEMPQEVASDDGSFTYKMNLYMATDKVNMMNYMVRYNDFPTDSYLINKTVVFDAIIADFSKKGKLIGQVKTIEKDGYEGRTYTGISGGTYFEVQFFLRGNRTYLLLRQNMSGDTKPKADQFFSSFKFEPYKTTGKVNYKIGDATFTFPAQPHKQQIKKEDNEEENNKYKSFLSDEVLYNITNPNTGALYFVSKSNISKYFRSKDIDSIIKAMTNRLSAENATLAPPISNASLGKMKGYQTVYLDSASGNYRKTQVLLSQNQFYYQYLIASKEEMESDAAQQFFSGIQFNDQQSAIDFTASKAKLITSDLLSNDLETHKAAHGALNYYVFEQSELPIIYDALKHKYTNDTSSTGTRVKLINTLNDVHDRGTTDFLKQLYAANKGADLVQASILQTLPQIDSTSYDWYLKQLIEAPTFKLNNYWSLFDPLTDSIAYSAGHIDQLLKLMQVKPYRPALLEVINQMVFAEGNPYQSLIESKKELISKHIDSDLEDDITGLQQRNYPKTISNYLNILPVLKLPQLTDNYTNKVIALDSVPYLHTHALSTRILAGLNLNQQILTAQLDTMSSRYTILHAFNKVGKLASVPLKYRKHDEFAKLLLYNYLDEEYGYPEEIKLLGNIKEGEKIYYVFDFTYTQDGVKKTYVGVAGAFNNKADELDFEAYNAYSTFELKEKDWQKQAKLMIKEL